MLSFQWSAIVAGITEIPPLMFLPNCLVQRRVLRPLRTQTGGTIMVRLLIHCSPPFLLLFFRSCSPAGHIVLYRVCASRPHIAMTTAYLKANPNTNPNPGTIFVFFANYLVIYRKLIFRYGGGTLFCFEIPKRFSTFRWRNNVFISVVTVYSILGFYSTNFLEYIP